MYIYVISHYRHIEMESHTRDVSIRCPSVRHDVASGKNVSQNRCCQCLPRPTLYRYHKTPPALTLNPSKNPMALSTVPTLVLGRKKIALIYFYNDWLSIFVKATDLC